MRHFLALAGDCSCGCCETTCTYLLIAERSSNAKLFPGTVPGAACHFHMSAGRKPPDATLSSQPAILAIFRMLRRSDSCFPSPQSFPFFSLLCRPMRVQCIVAICVDPTLAVSSNDDLSAKEAAQQLGRGSWRLSILHWPLLLAEAMGRLLHASASMGVSGSHFRLGQKTGRVVFGQHDVRDGPGGTTHDLHGGILDLGCAGLPNRENTNIQTRSMGLLHPAPDTVEQRQNVGVLPAAQHARGEALR